MKGTNGFWKALNLSQNEKKMIEHIILQMEEERQLDRAAAIADMRFSFIFDLVDKTVVKPSESKEHARSRRLDRILTGKYTALPAFAVIMALTFYLTFSVIGAWMQGILETLIGYVTDICDQAMTAWNVNQAVHSLVIDGIFNGVGSVFKLFADYCDSVFFPVSARGYWLYGKNRICHG